MFLLLPCAFSDFFHLCDRPALPLGSLFRRVRAACLQEREVLILLPFGLVGALESERDGVQLWECSVYRRGWEQKLGL